LGLLTFKEEVAGLLSSLIAMSPAEIAPLLEIPPEPGMGDYAFPCFVLARRQKKPPHVIAAELAARIEPGSIPGTVQNRGPYLNFYIDRPYLFEKLLLEITGRGIDYGKEKGQNKTIVIDYSAPNIAKPFGVGHLRSTVIGSALYRIYRALGYRVVGINHIGDWGTQFGKLIVAFRRWGDSSQLQKDPVHYLYHLYVQFHREAEKEPELNEEARYWFRKLELEDEDAVGIWEHFRGLSLIEFQRLYRLMGIEFDSYQGESFYNNMLEETLELVREKGLLKESEGALLADLEPYGLPPCLLRKKDGAALYITRDLAAAIYRYKTYRFSKLLYVVGAEQTLHFKQFFKLLELLGFPWADDCIHVPFGLIHFKDGRMSTREGKVIFLEDVINRAIEMAQNIIREKNPGLENKEKAAKAVGLGAIIFGDLVNDRIKDVEFDWEKVLDFSGETAPYVQYAHARICSILKKALGESATGSGERHFDGALARAEGLLEAPEEEQLLITLARFKEQLRRAAEEYRPSFLARYLLDLARDFNKFYHNCPVLTAGGSLKEARLLLIEGVRIVLHNGLELLGIEAPEEM
jgi:arginyl-tRNA synthetase